MSTLTPNVRAIAGTQPTASIAALEQERGAYSATPDFIRAHCGPIARGLLDLVPSWYYEEAKAAGLYPNCDIRIHRLYPGDYPAYPGWHCDGAYRETYFSQPDMDRTKVGRHIIATVSSVEGGVSNCEFIDQSIEVEPATEQTADHGLWARIDSQIRHMNPPPRTWTSEDGRLYLFDPWTLHRVRPARIRGWRLFFRMSLWYRPNLGDGGMISRQEQIYKIASEAVGW